LDRENGLTKSGRYPSGKVARRLTVHWSKWARSQVRPPTKEKLTRRFARAAARPMLNDVFGETEQRISEHLGVYNRMGEHGTGMNVGVRATFLDVDRATDGIDLIDCPKVRAVWQVEKVALCEVSLLRRVCITIDRAPRRAPDAHDVSKA
jgi:hypothetical protein